ncbi:hypothetical protein ASG86_10410 [Arthrobacter sp. Soil764]|nr:hypothetical protein ASG86_10410 [Arthrobacter sp. Soil764]
MYLPGAVLALFGALFMIMGIGVAAFRLPISRGHQRWMEMFAGRRGRDAADAMTPGTWLSIGVINALIGAGLMFAGFNLMLRH